MSSIWRSIGYYTLKFTVMAIGFKVMKPLIERAMFSLWPYERPPAVENKSKDDAKVLFFPCDTHPCWDYLKSSGGCTKENCKSFHGENSISKMCNEFEKAKKTLDVCIYLITFDYLSSVIIRAHKRGVKVRVLTNVDRANASGTSIVDFMREAIPVRSQKTKPDLMHHKFAVIDRKTLVNGSMNWTDQSILFNNESVIVTSRMNIVQAFIDEFERLWLEFQ